MYSAQRVNKEFQMGLSYQTCLYIRYLQTHGKHMYSRTLICICYQLLTINNAFIMQLFEEVL